MQLPLRTILIDDEQLALNRLRRLLTSHTDTFTVIGEALNGAEGLAKVETERPDLIFLDIEMPLLNGFDMLNRLTYMPLVVFATAFDQYAIRAFEENSVDYLLKPIELDRLERTVGKIRALADRNAPTGSNPFNENLMRLLEQMKPKKELFSISVKTGDKILLIPLTDIAYFEADDKYVYLVTVEGQKYLTTYTLSTLAEKLPDTFARVSRSVILNTHRIRAIQKHFDGKFIITLSDKKASRLTTGSSYTDRVRQLLEI